MSSTGRHPRPWFERTFANDMPLSHSVNLAARLAGAPARLEELVRDVSVAARTSRVDGEWSIQENAGHLLDLESLWQVRLDEMLAGVDTLTPADLENNATHQARHNERSAGELLAAFRATREGWVARVDALSGDDFGRVALHPRLGQPMRVVDLLAFVAEHDDHHLARIRQLRRELVELPAGR
ncbi:MAG: DinB family protein [Planctomycetota bacterium]